MSLSACTRDLHCGTLGNAFVCVDLFDEIKIPWDHIKKTFSSFFQIGLSSKKIRSVCAKKKGVALKFVVHVFCVWAFS
jgi:hypothetical protein